MFVVLLIGFTACGVSSSAAQNTGPTSTPTPSPTAPPPPPDLTYKPIEPGAVAPIIIQRLPRRGEELAPTGVIELVFDRAMNKIATAAAFRLQTAAERPRSIEGELDWPDERTLRFTPARPLERATVYDAILSQEAVATDGASLAEPFTFRFNTPGDLEISQVIPANGAQDIATDATITVMFNRPVVPLTSLAEAKNFPQPLELDPAIDGQGEWLNTSIYVFTPSGNLPGGAAITAKVKAGLPDVAGKTDLPTDFEWRFTTQPPEVVFTSPNDGQTLVPIETPIQITFSQPVSLESAKEKFSLETSGLFGGTVSGDFSLIDRTLTFTPSERLSFDTTYQVTVEAGVTGQAGGSGMASPYNFRFTTVPLPRLVETRPADGDNQAPPYTDITLVFNTPINPATVLDHLELTPPLPITPTAVYTTYSSWDNSFTLNFNVQPSTDYIVQISPGIEDPYGNKTTDSRTVRFRTQPLPPNYQFRTPGLVGTYDADLPAKLLVSYVNINTLNLRLYRLPPDDIQRPEWEWNEYQPAANTLIREWQARLEAAVDKPSFQAIDLVEAGGPLDPGLYLLETDSPQLERNQYHPRHVLVVSRLNLTLKTGAKEVLVWATDLASGQPVADQEIVFFDEERNQLGSATTDDHGVARLEFGSQHTRSSVMAAILTGSDSFSAVSEYWQRGISPSEFGLDYDYQPRAYTVHLYTDRPIYRAGQTVHFKGIIRAEDDVDFSRPDLGQVNITVYDAAYELVLEDTAGLSPAGTFNGSIELEEGAALGNYTIALTFAEEYVEHYFQVAAYRPPEFEITVEPDAPEVLRGDDLEATILANYFFGGPLANANVEWNVLAESYRFEPAQFGNYRFTDSDDPYVCFDCWWWFEESFPQSILSGSGVTAAAGQLPLTLSGGELDEILPTGSQRLTIEATATGPDNQFISGRTQVVVHKGDYYIGLSPQEYIADAGQETAVDLVAVDWTGQRLAEKELAVQIVRYEWVNTFVEENGGGYWQSETKKTLIDELSVTTDNQGEAIARFTPPQGGSYQVIAQDQATLQTPDNQPTETQPSNPPALQPSSLPTSPIRSSIFVWVAGEDNISWQRENHDRINLISDKAQYAPGDTAEILIPSPFEGKHYALVTVERGRIKKVDVIELTGSSQIYRLPLTAAEAPNIYVSVVLIQGRSGPTADDAPRLADTKVGLLPIDVVLTEQKLKIGLTAAPEQGQPGQEVTYTLQVTDVDNQPVSAAEVSLDLVDKAVLTLQPRQPEAIIKAFYDRRGLGINTASGLAVSVNRLLLELAEDLDLDESAFVAQSTVGEDTARYKALATALPAPAAPVAEMAAEEAEMAAADAVGGVANQAQLPPGVEIREDFSDTAYWNPVVVTDEQGRAEVTLTLPDNLTTWVMRGVGVTNQTQVGEAEAELVSTMPLLIRPVAPRFFVVDDKAQLAANVSNNTDTALETEVSLVSDEGIIIDRASPAVQTVTVPARGETKVTWEVTVQDVAQTELVFAAVSTDNKYQDAAKPRLSTGPDGSLLVLRYTAPDIVGTAGQLVAGGERTEVVALPPEFDERRGELTLQIDPSLAAGMRDGLAYLEHFEYECTEQTVSRFLPNVLTFNALQQLGLENKDLEARLPGLVEQGLNKLYTQQKPDGGWGWWSADESNVHVTAYVVFALTKAQQAGVDVSATVLSNGQNFLLDHLKSTRQLNSTFDANRHAFVLYALAEGGAAPGEALEALYDAREKLAHYARAYLALSLNLADAPQYQGEIDTLLSDLNNSAILSATGAHWQEAYYDYWAMNTDTRSTAIILDALAKLDPDNALIPNVVRWLMVARQDGIWETTQETAWALIALTDWMIETGELEADYDFTVLLNEEETLSGEATKATVQDSTQLTVALADLLADSSNRLTVARSDGNGRLYYSAHLKVYLPVETIEPAERGIIVNRRYTLESCLEAKSKDQSVECAEVRETKLGDVIRVDLTLIAPHDLYYVVVEDPLPAGAEAIDTGLATTSLLAMDPTLARTSRTFVGEDYGAAARPLYWWWWNWYSRSELRDEKVVLYADYLPQGTYEYSYTMRATIPGDYQVIPTVAQEFYFPEVFGRSDGRLLSIGR